MKFGGVCHRYLAKAIKNMSTYPIDLKFPPAGGLLPLRRSLMKQAIRTKLNVVAVTPASVAASLFARISRGTRWRATLDDRQF